MGFDLLLWIINNIKPRLLLLLQRHDKANSVSSNFVLSKFGLKILRSHVMSPFVSDHKHSHQTNPLLELNSIILDIVFIVSSAPKILGIFSVCIILRVNGSMGVLWFRLWIAKLRNAQIGVNLCKSFCLLQARWLWRVQRGMKLVKHCSDFVPPIIVMMTRMAGTVPVTMKSHKAMYIFRSEGAGCAY